MRDFKDYVDQYALVTMKVDPATGLGDGGDSCQKTSLFAMQEAMSNAEGSDQYKKVRAWFEVELKYLEVKPGIFIRHPVNYNQPEDFSRDQQTSLLGGLMKFKMYDKIWSMWWRHMLRFGKYQNADWANPAQMGYYPRAMHLWPFYPVYFIAEISLAMLIRGAAWWWVFGILISPDLWTFFGTLIQIYKAASDMDFVGDDKNCTIGHIISSYMPTHWIVFSKWLYKRFRPKSFGNFDTKPNPVYQGLPGQVKYLVGAEFIGKHNIQAAWDWDFKDPGPPLNEKWEPTLKEFYGY